MFKNSGMNHFIGDWEFKSIENCISNLSTFFSMLGLKMNDDVSVDEWQQLSNFVTRFNCAKK